MRAGDRVALISTFLLTSGRRVSGGETDAYHQTRDSVGLRCSVSSVLNAFDIDHALRKQSHRNAQRESSG